MASPKCTYVHLEPVQTGYAGKGFPEMGIKYSHYLSASEVILFSEQAAPMGEKISQGIPGKSPKEVQTFQKKFITNSNKIQVK